MITEYTVQLTVKTPTGDELEVTYRLPMIEVQQATSPEALWRSVMGMVTTAIIRSLNEQSK